MSVVCVENITEEGCIMNLHYECKKYDVGLHIDPYFELYHILLDYQVYYEIKLRVAVQSF